MVKFCPWIFQKWIFQHGSHTQQIILRVLNSSCSLILISSTPILDFKDVTDDYMHDFNFMSIKFLIFKLNCIRLLFKNFTCNYQLDGCFRKRKQSCLPHMSLDGNNWFLTWGHLFKIWFTRPAKWKKNNSKLPVFIFAVGRKNMSTKNIIQTDSVV